jgi:hypothetical protein
LNFFPVPSLTAVIILARSSQIYPIVAPISQGGFGVTEVRLPASIPSRHIGSSLLHNRIQFFPFNGVKKVFTSFT